MKQCMHEKLRGDNPMASFSSFATVDIRISILGVSNLVREVIVIRRDTVQIYYCCILGLLILF